MTDETATTEDETEDDDLLADLEDEDIEQDPEDEAKPAPKAKEKAKPEVAPQAKEDPSQSEFVAASLNALKSAWAADAAAAGSQAADFASIGLTGFDEAAKDAFMAAAAESHKAEVASLAKRGFVFKPEGDIDSQEAVAKQEWGKTGPGLAVSGDEKLNEQIASEVSKGDTMSVIDTLMNKGGMGEFFIRGKRG